MSQTRRWVRYGSYGRTNDDHHDPAGTQALALKQWQSQSGCEVQRCGEVRVLRYGCAMQSPSRQRFRRLRHGRELRCQCAGLHVRWRSDVLA